MKRPEIISNSKRRSCFFSMSILVLLTMLSACRVTKQYHQPSDMVSSQLFRRSSLSIDTATLATMPWQQMFTDTLLQALIQQGITNNLDLQTAVIRIQQAKENLRQSKLQFLPSLSVTATGEKIRPSEIQSANKQLYEIYAATSWEADIWGKLKSSRRASLASLLQSDAYKRAVQTQIIAEIAINYYTLMAYDAQLKITLETLDNRIKDVETMKVLKESDVVTGAAVVQSQANRFSVEVTIPDIEQNIRQTENAISILLGKDPGTIKRDSLSNQTVTEDLKTGVPSQLLANRPDVQQAEYQFRNSFELVNVAKTYFFPALTITAQGGLYNNSISQFFNTSSLFGNVIGGLVQPIFNNGINKQRLRIAQSEQQANLIAFRQTLLNAGQEVSNALYSYQAASTKINIRTQQIAFLQKSVDYTKQLLKYTTATNYTDVLTSEQSLLSAELNGVNDRLQKFQAMVTLYRSLGGGWK